MLIGKDTIFYAITTTPPGVADVDAPPRPAVRAVSSNGDAPVKFWQSITGGFNEDTAHSGKGIGDAHSAHYAGHI